MGKPLDITLRHCAKADALPGIASPSRCLLSKSIQGRRSCFPVAFRISRSHNFTNLQLESIEAPHVQKHLSLLSIADLRHFSSDDKTKCHQASARFAFRGGMRPSHVRSYYYDDYATAGFRVGAYSST